MAKRKKRRWTAKTADRYELYTEAVQDPEAEVKFARRIYRKQNGSSPIRVREDFCGTAAICCAWVRSDTDTRAIGVDLDPVPLHWGRRHHVAKLRPDQAERVELIQQDVLALETRPVDVILALNFSFCVFKQRAVLLRYLRRCHEALAKGGIMIMDIYGGPDAQRPKKDRTRKEGFTYVWDQARYNPITNEALNHIRFDFPDGSRIKKAFTYDWRLWTLPELRDALLESGFADAHAYWEGTDEDGEGNGVFRRRERVEVEDAWIAYIVGSTKSA